MSCSAHEVPQGSMLGPLSALTCISHLRADVAMSRLYLGAVGHIQLQDMQVFPSCCSQLLRSSSVYIENPSKHSDAHGTEALRQGVTEA